MKLRSVKGFHDILPEEIKRWHFIEDKAKSVLEIYGFEEIRIPHMEYTDLFSRGIGTTTDIIEKEMYTFNDRDGSSLSLRPEGTAGVVRSYIENSMHARGTVNKIYYIGNMFRHERPQKGRYRGFNQIGAEFFGSYSPAADAETISMLWQIFDHTGLTGSTVIEINSIGDPNSRKIYRNELKKNLTPHKDELCNNCQRKLETNPLRILDCKNKHCNKITRDAPSILDFISEESREHFENVKRLLDLLELPYTINDRIVRGLDYYTETVFEITTDLLGAQNAVAAGGRYNDLVELMGGKPTPAVGFAIGMERVVLLHKMKYESWPGLNINVYVAWMGKDSFETAFKIANYLRKYGISTEIEHSGKSLKSQLKRANKLNADYCLIIGEDELKTGKLKLRNMSESTEKEMPVEDIDMIIANIRD